ncbi:MAG: hypothetical protein KDN22_32530, partial [Verrucomicrobiae bacterium]|nr:hypothetical protein [Verrucomicrobiae bacterium]
ILNSTTLSSNNPSASRSWRVHLMSALVMEPLGMVLGFFGYAKSKVDGYRVLQISSPQRQQVGQRRLRLALVRMERMIHGTSKAQ